MATAPQLSPVETELNSHKTELNEWIVAIQKLTIPDSCQGVCDRFIRDCNMLITNIDDSTSPSSADLCDYVDRKNSLELQYHNLVDEYGE